MFPFLVTQYFMYVLPVPEVKVYEQVVVVSGLMRPMYCFLASRMASCAAGSGFCILCPCIAGTSKKANVVINYTDFFIILQMLVKPPINEILPSRVRLMSWTCRLLRSLW